MDTKPDGEAQLAKDMTAAEYAFRRKAVIRDAAAKQQEADAAAELERVVARRSAKKDAP